MAESDRARWNAKYDAMTPDLPEPSAALVALRGWLPESGRVLDLAGGAGANALYLAGLGFEVTLVDVSDRGLALARERAELAELPLTLVRADLEHEPLLPGPWGLILSSHYLQRDLIARAAAALAPGGRLIWIHPTKTNLECHAKPSARFLLDPGEAEAIVAATGLELRVAEEGWFGEGPNARHLARIVADNSTIPS